MALLIGSPFPSEFLPAIRQVELVLVQQLHIPTPHKGTCRMPFRQGIVGLHQSKVLPLGQPVSALYLIAVVALTDGGAGQRSGLTGGLAPHCFH